MYIKSESYLLTFGTCKSARIAQLGEGLPAYPPSNPTPRYSSQREMEEWLAKEERRKKMGKVVPGKRLLSRVEPQKEEEGEGGAVFKRQLFVLQDLNNSRINEQNRMCYQKVFGPETNRVKGNE